MEQTYCPYCGEKSARDETDPATYSLESDDDYQDGPVSTCMIRHTCPSHHVSFCEVD